MLFRTGVAAISAYVLVRVIGSLILNVSARLAARRVIRRKRRAWAAEAAS